MKSFFGRVLLWFNIINGVSVLLAIPLGVIGLLILSCSEYQSGWFYFSLVILGYTILNLIIASVTLINELSEQNTKKRHEQERWKSEHISPDEYKRQLEDFAFGRRDDLPNSKK